MPRPACKNAELNPHMESQRNFLSTKLFKNDDAQEADKNILSVSEMSGFHKIKGVKTKDRIMNTYIKSDFGMEVDVIQRITEEGTPKQCACRSNENRLPNVALFGYQHGRNEERTTQKKD